MERHVITLKRHPLNAKIYGDLHDQDLLDSIKAKGILTPLVITQEDVIISGHRRQSAAIILGLEMVPVFVSPLTDPLDIEEAVIITNKEQRNRTKEQIAREYSYLKEIESDRARRRMSLGGQGGLGQGVVNSSQLPQVQIDTSRESYLSGKARDLAASKLGIGSQSAERSAKVVQVIDGLESIGGTQEANILRETLNTQSVNAAFTQAKEIIADNPEIIKVNPKVFNLAKLIEECEHCGNKTVSMIKWAKWSWNPVRGCYHGCEYCYARADAMRREGNFDYKFYPERLEAPQNTRIPEARKDEPGINNVFVCSMADLFGEWVPEEVIQEVINACKNAPQWTFIFLTKNPKRLVEIDWPTNAWVGTTVDTQKRADEATKIFKDPWKVKPTVSFISMEPLLENIVFENLDSFGWIIIGSQSSSSGCPAFQPEWEWVESILLQARQAGCKVYFKDNLKVKPEEYPKG